MPLRKGEVQRQSEFGRPRVIVCGSRNFWDKEYVWKKLDFYTQLLSEPIIVLGGARGVDELAFEWAMARRHTVKIFHPEWDQYGSAAGPRRNQEMADYAIAHRPGYMPAYCVAFWNYQSAGTGSMIEKAKKARIKVVTINVLTGEVEVWPKNRG